MGVRVVCVFLFFVFHCVLCHLLLSKQSEPTAASTGSNRLSHDIIPLSYHIHLKPHFQANNFSFDGNLLLYFNVVNNSIRDIVLHSVDLNVLSVLLEDRTDRNATVSINCTSSVDAELGRLTVHADAALNSSALYALTVLYTAPLRGSDDLRGFYYGSYIENNQTVYFGATQFEPTHARKAFPCLDEPGFRAQFMVHILRDPSLMTISNVQLMRYNNNTPGMVMDIYELSEPMPSYLAAFFIGNFSKSTQGNNSVYSRKDYIGHTNYALSLIPTVLDTIANFVTIPFMLKKLDIVAVPDFMAGAMENWGMVTFREEYSLFAQGVSNEQDKKNILTIICHEFAHQWFGDLVTPAWWSDLWLNEGFARYFQYIIADLIEPNWRLLEDFTVNAVQSALAIDTDDTHAMTFDVLSDDNIKFDTIVYSKAASVIRMWELIFTRGVFQNALYMYLTKVSQADGIANTADLFASFESAIVPSSVHFQSFTATQFLENWTFTPGYPVVNIVVENGNISAEQKRFSPSGKVYNTDQWYIPLTYATQQQMKFNDAVPRVWLQPNKGRVFIGSVPNNVWFVANLNQTGYYRVNYTENNWQLLIQQLKTDLNQIPPATRAQLVDDAFTFARHGQLNYSVAFSLANYLVNEVDYIPWVSATKHLKLIIESFYYFSGIDQIQAYAYNLYKNFYNKVINNSSNDHITKLARMEAFQWACNLGYQPCIDSALNLYEKWLQGSQIDPELKPGMLCTAVRLRPSDWTSLNNMYLASKVSTDKVVFLKGLACSDQKYLIQPFMGRALKGIYGDVKRQNADIVINALLETPDNVNPIIVFVLNNYLLMKQYLGERTVNSYVSTIGKKVTAHSELNTLLDTVSNELYPVQFRQQVNASYNYAKARHTWCHGIVNTILQNVAAGLDEIVITPAPTTQPAPTTARSTTVAATQTTAAATQTTAAATQTTAAPGQPSGSSTLCVNCLPILLCLVYAWFRIC